MYYKFVRCQNDKLFSPDILRYEWQVTYIPNVAVSAKIGKLFVYNNEDTARHVTGWSKRDYYEQAFQLWECEVTNPTPCPEIVPIGYFHDLFESFWAGTWDPTYHPMKCSFFTSVCLCDTVKLIRHLP